jgi:hypothetical protein
LKKTLIAIPLLATVVALLFAFRESAPVATRQQPASEVSGQVEATSAPASRPRTPVADPRIAAAPQAQLPDAQALRARDDRRRDAVASLGASILPGLDRCVGAGPGPRSPRRLVLSFERAPSGDPAQERFRVARVDPVDASPGDPSIGARGALACISTLVGTTLDIPTGSAPQEPRFQEVVAIPLPTSVGWAGRPAR